MLCPVCQAPMVPLFMSLACPYNCDPRTLVVAEALYNAARDTIMINGVSVSGEPWEQLDQDTKNFFLRFAHVAIKALESA